MGLIWLNDSLPRDSGRQTLLKMVAQVLLKRILHRTLLFRTALIILSPMCLQLSSRSTNRKYLAMHHSKGGKSLVEECKWSCLTLLRSPVDITLRATAFEGTDATLLMLTQHLRRAYQPPQLPLPAHLGRILHLEHRLLPSLRKVIRIRAQRSQPNHLLINDGLPMAFLLVKLATLVEGACHHSREEIH